MNSGPLDGSVVLDRLDEQIVRSLQLAPRAPFRRIADVLGVSEQTVARRYRALRRNGILHVVAVVDPAALGESNWIVRIHTRPDATLEVGRALGQRPDVGWVSVSAGGAELVCVVRSHTQEQRERLLVDRLPRTAAVRDVSASVVLRRFLGGSATDWLGVQDSLTPEQAARYADELPSRSAPRRGQRLDAADYAMLDVLARDGRAPIESLARATGYSPGRVTRRLAALVRSGVVYLDVDVAAGALGYPTSAYVWLTVPPARLEAACRTLAGHQEASFVAAMSGRANVLASVTCRSLDDLYRYVTDQVGAVEGVQSCEVSPVLRRLKQAGTFMDGDHLAVS